MTTLYKPKFCCECGEKIVRDDWGIFTSRRFCPVCETEYKGAELTAKGVMALAVLICLGWVISGMLPSRAADNNLPVAKSGLQPRPLKSKPRNAVKSGTQIETGSENLPDHANSSFAAHADEADLNHSAGAEITGSENAGAESEGERFKTQRAVSEQPGVEKRTSEKKEYFCGITTRKGTPCSRRVKHKGDRCWQHARIDLE